MTTMSDFAVGVWEDTPTATTTYVRRLSEVGEKYVDFALNPKNRVRTGYLWIDSAIKGIAPGEVAILAAGRNSGKTNMLCNIVVNNPDTPILFFSLEMADILILARLYAITFAEEFRSLEERLRNDASGTLADSMIHELHNRLPFLGICDKGGMTFSQMDEAISEYETMFAATPRLIMIDYAELISTTGIGDVSLNRVFVQLREIGKSRNLGVLVAHQLNRGALYEREGGPVRLLDLRSAGDAEADYVIAIYRRVNAHVLAEWERDNHRHTVHAQVLKNRSGEGRGVDLGEEMRFSPATLRIAEY